MNNEIYESIKINICFRALEQYSLTTKAPEPEKIAGSEYCSRSHCYTPTEFAIFGVGTVVMGIMVGVVGISWFKHQCLPDEYKDMREREKERTELDVERQPSETDFLSKKVCF